MVELGKSDVPLEEDLIKKKIEFVKSWTEWNAINSEQISKHLDRFNAIGTIYEVPENKTFFLTFAQIVCYTTGVAPLGDKTSWIFAGATNNPIIKIDFPLRAAFEHGEANANFTMPLKFESGQKILLTAGTETFAHATLIGFLIDKKISP